ncbi:MAG: Cell division protein FtsH, partial [uncultured Solirubrobacteraceae bacterium]
GSQTLTDRATHAHPRPSPGRCRQRQEEPAPGALAPDRRGDPARAGDELLRHVAAGSRPRPRREDPVQPVLPRPGAGRQRRARLAAGHHGRRALREGGPLPGRRRRRRRAAHARLRDRGTGLRRRRDTGATASGQRRRHRPGAAQRRPRTVPEPAARIRSGAAACRALRLPRTPRQRRPDGRARRLRALAGQTGGGLRSEDHLQRRRRHRRGRGRARRDRRLPQEPRALPEARRTHPARRPALGPSRDRQDAVGARHRRRGRRAVLLGVGVRVRRGDRRHRRLARPRPLPAGQGGGPGDRLHRRARRDRPLALRRRRGLRRQRRARADAQPDPDRDGRLRVRLCGDRAGRHQPPRSPRRRSPATGSLRPPHHGAGPRQGGAREDPQGPHALAAAALRGRPRAGGGHHARHGRRRPGQP